MRIILLSTGVVNLDRSLEGVSSDDTSHSEIEYTIGTAPLYYYESSSWIEAEYKARVELVVSSFSNYRGQRISIDSEIFETSITKTDATIRNVRTVRRSIDRENGVVKVWITGYARSNPG